MSSGLPDLERYCGVPWHRADLGFFGAHVLSRCARVARMDSCGPLLATHFLLEKQVGARQRRPLGCLTGAGMRAKTRFRLSFRRGMSATWQDLLPTKRNRLWTTPPPVRKFCSVVRS